MKPRRDDRGRHGPDRRPRQDHVQHLPAMAAQPPFAPAAAAFDEPLDRVVARPPRRQDRRRSDEHGCREKRELRADAKELRRMPDEHNDRGRRQGVDGQRPPSQRAAQAGEPDEERGPHDGRLGANQQHVEAGADGHRHERPAAGHGQRAEDRKQGQGQNSHVEPGDREDVDRAGDQKFPRFLGRQRLAAAEQEGRRQRRPCFREMCAKHLDATRPHPIDRCGERQAGGHGDHPQALLPMTTDDRQAAEQPRPLAEIKLTGVGSRRRTDAPTEHAYPAAGRDPRRRAIDDHSRAAGGRPPHAAGTAGLHHDHAFARRTNRDRPQGIRSRGREQPRRLDKNALDRDRRRCLVKAPRQIVGCEQAMPRNGPAGSRTGNRDEEQHGCGERLPTAEKPPGNERPAGDQPPAGDGSHDSC